MEVVKLKTKVELLETKVAEQAFLLKECKMSSDKKYEKMPLEYNREKVDSSTVSIVYCQSESNIKHPRLVWKLLQQILH